MLTYIYHYYSFLVKFYTFLFFPLSYPFTQHKTLVVRDALDLNALGQIRGLSFAPSRKKSQILFIISSVTIMDCLSKRSPTWRSLNFSPYNLKEFLTLYHLI